MPTTLRVKFYPETGVVASLGRAFIRTPQVVSYREQLRSTPTGGRFMEKRLTLRHNGKRFVGKVDKNNVANLVEC